MYSLLTVFPEMMQPPKFQDHSKAWPKITYLSPFVVPRRRNHVLAKASTFLGFALAPRKHFEQMRKYIVTNVGIYIIYRSTQAGTFSVCGGCFAHCPIDFSTCHCQHITNSSFPLNISWLFSRWLLVKQLSTLLYLQLMKWHLFPGLAGKLHQKLNLGSGHEFHGRGELESFANNLGKADL